MRQRRSRHRGGALQRLYDVVAGIVFVYDMSSVKSFQNVRRWARELYLVDTKKKGVGILATVRRALLLRCASHRILALRRRAHACARLGSQRGAPVYARAERACWWLKRPSDATGWRQV
jgi:hypothetical protein